MGKPLVVKKKSSAPAAEAASPAAAPPTPASSVKEPATAATAETVAADVAAKKGATFVVCLLMYSSTGWRRPIGCLIFVGSFFTQEPYN